MINKNNGKYKRVRYILKGSKKDYRRTIISRSTKMGRVE